MLAAVHQLDISIQLLKDRREQVLQEVQTNCLHPQDSLVEGSYVSNVWTAQPFRVCKLCGYAEEGWGCGYWKLCGAEVAIVPRDIALELILKFYSQEALNKVRFHHSKESA